MTDCGTRLFEQEFYCGQLICSYDICELQHGELGKRRKVDQ